MKRLLALILFATSVCGAQGLTYASYLGGNSEDLAHGITVDESGNMYVVGWTVSQNFPVLNAYQPKFSGTRDAFVARFNPDGYLSWSTFLGGTTGTTLGSAIALTPDGNVVVTGTTASTKFPTTPGVLQTKIGTGTSAFVTEFSPTGTLIWSTYLGWNMTNGNSIAVSSLGNIFVAGDTVTPTGGMDGFVTEINSSGTAVSFTQLLGGSGADSVRSLTLNGEQAYVTGYTQSDDFPTTPNVFGSTCGSGSGDYSGFVASVSALGVAYDGCLRGSGSLNVSIGIGVDLDGNSYVTGTTNSADWPGINANSFQQVYGGATDLSGGLAGCLDFISGRLPCGDAFMTKISPDGSAILWSTYLGGSTADIGYAVTLDTNNSPWIIGYTQSYACSMCKPVHTPFPTTPGAYQTIKGGGLDGFAAHLSPDGSTLLYSTYFGGITDEEFYSGALDPFGNICFVGRSFAGNTPVTANAFQFNFGGPPLPSVLGDAFITQIQP